jgi:hypothetical protein
VRLSAGRVVLIVLGAIGVLVGLALLAGGGFLLWADRTQREDGYLTTPSERFETPTYALTRTRLDVETNGADWVLNDNWFGKIRIRGEGAEGKTIFMGIGPEPAVAKYLGNVAHASVEDVDFDPFRATYRSVAGGAPQGPPADQRFWVASASGVGTQTLTWKVRDGDWTVVLMNADGSRGVDADIDLGAKLDSVSAQVAKMDGKLEAYSASLGQLSNRVDLLDQRQQTSDAAAKEWRQERQSFQAETSKRLGDLEGQVRVLNAMRGQR